MIDALPYDQVKLNKRRLIKQAKKMAHEFFLKNESTVDYKGFLLSPYCYYYSIGVQRESVKIRISLRRNITEFLLTRTQAFKMFGGEPSEYRNAKIQLFNNPIF